MRYSVDELSAFVAMVELNSFSAAARKLHITQLALSRRIAKVEEGVGETLLLRRIKNIEPTSLSRHGGTGKLSIWVTTTRCN